MSTATQRSTGSLLRILAMLCCLLVAGASMAQAAEEVAEVKVLGHGTNFVYVTVVQADDAANPNPGQPLSGGPYVYTWSFVERGNGGTATPATYVFPRNNTTQAQTTRIVFITDGAQGGEDDEGDNDLIRVTVSTQSGVEVGSADFRMPEGPDYSFDVGDIEGGIISPADAGMLRNTEMAFSAVALWDDGVTQGVAANVAVDWSAVRGLVDDGDGNMVPAGDFAGTFLDDNSIVGNGRFFASSAGLGTVRATFIGASVDDGAGNDVPVTAQTSLEVIDVATGTEGAPVITSQPWADDAIVDIEDGSSATTLVHVRAEDNQQENRLRYLWEAEDFRPYLGAEDADVVPTVLFSPNGSNQAKDATATFAFPGVYDLRVTVFDPDGNAVESAIVTVAVKNTGNINDIVKLELTPASQNVALDMSAEVEVRFLNAISEAVDDVSGLDLEGLFVWATTAQTALLVDPEENRVTHRPTGQTAPTTYTITYSLNTGHPAFVPQATATVTERASEGLGPVIFSVEGAEDIVEMGASVDLVVTASDDGGAELIEFSWLRVSGPRNLSMTVDPDDNEWDYVNQTALHPGDALVGDEVSRQTVRLEPVAAGDYVIRVSARDQQGNVTTHDVTLMVVEDLDADPVIGFVTSTTRVTEGNAGDITEVRVDVVRTGSANREVAVDYQVREGTASLGSDFMLGEDTQLAGRLFWGRNDSPVQSLYFNIVGDDIPEPDETFQIILSNESDGAELGVFTVHTVTIVNDDGQVPSGGTITFTQPEYFIVEDQGSLTVGVRRDGAAAGRADVRVALRDLTAVEGDDYTAPAVTLLTWGDGETGKKEVEIPVLDRPGEQNHRRFQVEFTQLEASTEVTVGNPATVTILDKDGVATITLPGTPVQAIQESEPVTVAVPVSRTPTGQATAIRYRTLNGTAVAGIDYEQSGGWIIWNQGDAAAQNISVPTLASVVPKTSRFYVVIDEVVGGTVTGGIQLIAVDINNSAAPGVVRQVHLDPISRANYEWSAEDPAGIRIEAPHEETGSQWVSNTSSGVETRLTPSRQTPSSAQ